MNNQLDPSGITAKFSSGENARLSFLDLPDVRLSVRVFEVEEGMNQLFHVRLECVSAVEEIDLSLLVGQRANFELSWRPDRQWRGICESVEFIRISDEAAGLATYEVCLRPGLWRLGERIQNRLFQHASIPAIVKTILDEWKIEHEWKVETMRYPPLELRTQYGESDLAFVSRLLEEAGISYWFVDDGKDASRLVLGDVPHRNQVRPGGTIAFVDDATLARSARSDYLTNVRLRERSRPGRFTARDYDFMLPRLALFAQSDAERNVEHAHEQYRFMPGFGLAENPAMATMGTTTPTADDLGFARYREDYAQERLRRMMQAAHADRRVVTYEASVADLSPGAVFVIGRHPRPDLGDDRAWLVVRHSVRGKIADSGSWQFAGAAVSTEEVYRPPQITPKPRIQGLHTAVVVGPGPDLTGAAVGGVLGAIGNVAGGIAAIGHAAETAVGHAVGQAVGNAIGNAVGKVVSPVASGLGAVVKPNVSIPVPGGVGVVHKLAVEGAEAANALVDNTIHVDEHGRVRVQFPWDRDHGFDRQSSIWMRVSQGWAGAGYGLFTIPRVGHEVLVAFLDGDPDCPLVVGRVHNAAEPTPYPLPAAKTVSTWKTASSPGGMGANELRFDDAAGAEHVYLQAQKDMDHLVKKDLKQAIGGSSSRYVQTHDTHAVGGTRTDFVNVNEARAVGMNQASFVGMNRTSHVGVEDQTLVGTRWGVTIARGLTSQLVQDLEKVAGDVGDVVRSAATTVLGGIPASPLSTAAQSALANLGNLLFSGLQALVETAATGGLSTENGPPPTSIEMVDRQIKLTTGEASIILDGPNVTISAQGNIVLHALDNISVLGEKEVAIGGRGKVALVSATEDVIVQAKKDLHLNPFESGGKVPEVQRLDPPQPTIVRPEQCIICESALVNDDTLWRSCTSMQGVLPAGKVTSLAIRGGLGQKGESFAQEARSLLIETQKHGWKGDVMEHVVDLVARGIDGVQPSYDRVLAWLLELRHITPEAHKRLAQLSPANTPTFSGIYLGWWTQGREGPEGALWSFGGGATPLIDPISKCQMDLIVSLPNGTRIPFYDRMALQAFLDLMQMGTVNHV
jgi:Rhs element Vgr protein